MPDVLIVGIGYPGGQRQGSLLRNHDYTPTPDPEFAELLQALAGGRGPPITTGGAPAFLRFVRDELKPWVNANYPADPGDATVIGASFGGLFGLYSLFEEPATFQRYVLSSPSIWWDDGMIAERERAHAAARTDLRTRIFVGVGGRENAVDDAAYRARMPAPVRNRMDSFETSNRGGVRMIEAIVPFVSSLQAREYPGLRISCQIFPDETHASVAPASITRGLRVVFETFGGLPACQAGTRSDGAPDTLRATRAPQRPGRGTVGGTER
jgi:hypothetical protein